MTFSLLGLALSQGFAQPQRLVESCRATSAPLDRVVPALEHRLQGLVGSSRNA